jgi:hypothetical protein
VTDAVNDFDYMHRIPSAVAMRAAFGDIALAPT